jgi:hypothetical protein
VIGFTIAKDRARLASDTANELIYLHDGLPGIQKYCEAERFDGNILVYSCTWINDKQPIFLYK